MTTRTRWLLTIGLLALALGAIVWAGLQALSRDANLSGALGPGGEAGLLVPPGFHTNVYAQGLDGPRFIAFGPDGDLYVAERGAGRIVVLSDEDGDGVAEARRNFSAELDAPHSLAYHAGAWHVGVPRGVIRLEDRDGDGIAEIRNVLINSYPTDGHATRTVEFLPDGRMVVSVGSSCNVCLEEDSRRAAILIYDDATASGERIFAIGLRNAVGLAVHPLTGELWATNNGRDFMGDDLPPDTIHLVADGDDHGWPRCHSGRIIDPDFGSPNACAGVPPPLVEIQAHSAPLGLAFYTAGQFPEPYRGDLFVAYHGSWNRSVPTGYKVVRVPLDGANVVGEVEDFVVGWLDEATGEASGRPVGLAVGPDGALYISDDKAGFIYRISYPGS